MMNIKLFVSLRGSSLTNRLWAWGKWCSSKNAVFLSSSMALHTSLMISSRWTFFYSFLGIPHRKYFQFMWIVQIFFMNFQNYTNMFVGITNIVNVCFLWIFKIVYKCFSEFPETYKCSLYEFSKGTNWRVQVAARKSEWKATLRQVKSRSFD